MLDAVMPTYARQDVAFVKGDGSWLTDDQGRRYLDAVGGLAVAVLGHADPALARTLAEQSQRLLHTSNLYRIPAQEELAQKLTGLSGMDSAFFANSGAEANECALKIARKFGQDKGLAEPSILVMDGAFHGRTLATLSATGSRRIQAGFEPLVQGFVRVPFNDLATIEQLAKSNKQVVATLVEPIQGEGGVRMPDADYLPRLRQICDAEGWLLMLDEIQTGNGRTGHWFAYQGAGAAGDGADAGASAAQEGMGAAQHGAGVLPDVVTLAKGLANGLPIGVCLARGAAAQVLGPGNHGSTFGGNPLACAAALTVLGEIERQGLVARAGALGERLLARFRERLGSLNVVKDIRGQGLMIGIELADPCGELVGKALEKGLLINVAAEKVIRLLPPLTLTDEEADLLATQVCELVENQ